MPGKRRLTREALEAELRRREEELARLQEELAWLQEELARQRQDGATPEQLAMAIEKLDSLKPGFDRLMTELVARRAEKPAETLARMRKGTISEKMPYRKHTLASEKLMGDIANLALGKAEVARRIIKDCGHHGVPLPRSNRAVEDWVQRLRELRK
jgi:hypothetical protein